MKDMEGLLVADKVHALGFPKGEYVLIGGGALAIRGMRETGDVDLVVSRRLYGECKKGGWEECVLCADDGKMHRYLSKGDADVFPHYRRGLFKPSTADLIARAEEIYGISVMSIDDLVLSKRALARPHDLLDLRRIEEYRRIHGI